MNMVSDFRNQFAVKLAAHAVTCQKWSGATQKSDHMLELNTKPKRTVLYIKESNKDPGFWGLTRNQLEALRTSTLDWFAVLLLRSSTSGYLLSSGQVERRIDDGRFELSGDGDHKVNETQDLSDGQNFSSVQEIIDRIL